MGLAASQINLLTLTRRKASCELGISIDAMRKMQLTREMSQLTQEYNSKLSAKQVVYHADNSYHKVDYQYLMGNRSTFSNVGFQRNTSKIKNNYNMVLTDYTGKVVLSNYYANAIMKVCNVGLGGSFSMDKLPEILEELNPAKIFTADNYRNGVENYTWSATGYSPVQGSGSAHATTGSSTTAYNEAIENIIAYFYPIFLAASVNGWTVDYNNQINNNDDYLTDAIVSGTLVLAEVDEYGQYDGDATLTYFSIAGDIDLRPDTSKREELTREYDAEKERIAEKESWIDLEMEDLSTELEAIKTEIESVKTYVNDAIQSVFSWGNA